MSYLVSFKDDNKEWQESFKTEQELLQELEVKDLKIKVTSIKKIDEELTLEQLQQKVDYSTSI